MDSEENKENQDFPEETQDIPKKRITLTSEERLIFRTLVSTGNNGKWGTVILSESGNNMKKCEVWQEITNAFNSHTGRALTRVQLRGVFNKEKEKLKKKHDRTKTDRKLKKSCNLTGAGKAPQIPPDLDGDESFLCHELDPTPTLFNQLTKPHSKQPSPDEEKLDGFDYSIIDVQGNPLTDSMGNPVAAINDLFNQKSTDYSVTTSHNISFVPPTSSTPKSSLATKNKKGFLSSSHLGALTGTIPKSLNTKQASSSTPTLNKSTPRTKTTSGNQEGVTISTSPANAQKQTGSSNVTTKPPPLNPIKASDNREKQVKGPQNKSTAKQIRKRGPFNANDYYSNVYQIQKKVSTKRMKLISQKIVNEKFKAVLLKKKLRDLELDDNVTESESDYSSDSEGFTGSEDEDPHLTNM